MHEKVRNLQVGKKALITTSDWFMAPNGLQYKAAFGTIIRVASSEAAQWIADNWDDLSAGKYTNWGRSVKSNNLLNAFDWHLTPEPFTSDYWTRIYKRLCSHNPVQYTGM